MEHHSLRHLHRVFNLPYQETVYSYLNLRTHNVLVQCTHTIVRYGCLLLKVLNNFPKVASKMNMEINSRQWVVILFRG